MVVLGIFERRDHRSEVPGLRYGWLVYLYIWSQDWCTMHRLSSTIFCVNYTFLFLAVSTCTLLLKNSQTLHNYEPFLSSPQITRRHCCRCTLISEYQQLWGMAESHLQLCSLG